MINTPNETSGQVDPKFYTRESLAQEYHLSSKTVARYLRINQLITPLKAALDNEIIAFIPAVEVSFLPEDTQYELAQCIEDGYRVDMKKAAILRDFSENGKLDSARMIEILLGTLGKKPPPNRTPTVKINKSVYARYFQPNQPVKEVQAIVEKALEMYFGK